MHILFTIQSAFSLWMLADAYQRRAGTHWYFIVLLPFGEVAYFFMVKIHDPEIQKLRRKFLVKPPKLSELEYRASTSPSVHNQLLFGQALHDAEEFSRSIEVLREVLQKDSTNKAALHAIALSLIEIRDTTEAVKLLEQLVDLDLAYDDYSPCADLASAYWQRGEQERALELLTRVVTKSKRISHRVELARYLQQSSQSEKAKQMLEEVLLDYDNSPAYLRKETRHWAREAKKILRTS